MILMPQEAQRLQFLLGKQRVQLLNADEEYELRMLISKEQPAAQNQPLDELVKLGVFLVGLYVLGKMLEDVTTPDYD